MGYDNVSEPVGALRAAFEVSGRSEGLVPGELAGKEAHEIRAFVLNAAVVCHVASPSATSKSVSLCIPLAMRALMVPMGEPTRSAISAWVSPEK
jgi:hypothetical protein